MCEKERGDVRMRSKGRGEDLTKGKKMGVKKEENSERRGQRGREQMGRVEGREEMLGWEDIEVKERKKERKVWVTERLNKGEKSESGER